MLYIVYQHRGFLARSSHTNKCSIADDVTGSVSYFVALAVCWGKKKQKKKTSRLFRCANVLRHGTTVLI